jgi:hypothetical protein
VKKYRVMYKPSESANELAARTEEVYADGWRVETDKVVLFAHEQDADILVLDIPKTLIMRIQEIGS